MLVGTTTQSNTNLEMLADSMKYVAPTAAAMGQSIETVSVAIGMPGNAGIKGSRWHHPAHVHAKAGQAPKDGS